MSAKVKIVIAAVAVFAVAATAYGVVVMRKNSAKTDVTTTAALTTAVADDETTTAPEAEATTAQNTGDTETTTSADLITTVKSEDDFNDRLSAFLSVLTKTRFSSDAQFSADSPNDNELIRFAYAFARLYLPDEVVTAEYDGTPYMGVRVETAQWAISQYFGIDAPSQPGEGSPFVLRDGAFVMPAAGGMPSGGEAQVKSCEVNGSLAEVSFVIRSGDEQIGAGNATVEIVGDSFRAVEFYQAQ